MFLFQKLLNYIRSWFRRDTTYRLDMEVNDQLKLVAMKEKRPPQEVAKAMIANGVQQYLAQNESATVWHNLSYREQQVVALICLGMSNGQIANQLHLSESTVKTYAGSAYDKFGVQNRNELRRLLRGWDFRDWAQLE